LNGGPDVELDGLVGLVVNESIAGGAFVRERGDVAVAPGLAPSR
jgi:hypothetical protein